MGKQAKRKQNRERDNFPSPSESPNSYSSTDFIREIQQQGYQWQNVRRSPDLPSNKAEPQL